MAHPSPAAFNAAEHEKDKLVLKRLDDCAYKLQQKVAGLKVRRIVLNLNAEGHVERMEQIEFSGYAMN